MQYLHGMLLPLLKHVAARHERGLLPSAAVLSSLPPPRAERRTPVGRRGQRDVREHRPACGKPAAVEAAGESQLIPFVKV